MIASTTAAPAMIMSARSGLIAGSFRRSSSDSEQRTDESFLRFLRMITWPPTPLPPFLKSLFDISARLIMVPDDPQASLMPYFSTLSLTTPIFWPHSS